MSATSDPSESLPRALIPFFPSVPLVPSAQPPLRRNCLRGGGEALKIRLCSEQKTWRLFAGLRLTPTPRPDNIRKMVKNERDQEPFPLSRAAYKKQFLI